MRMRVLESLGCNKCRLRMFSFLAKYVCDNFIIYANVVAGKFVKCPPFNLIVTDCRSFCKRTKIIEATKWIVSSNYKRYTRLEWRIKWIKVFCVIFWKMKLKSPFGNRLLSSSDFLSITWYCKSKTIQFRCSCGSDLVGN